MKSLERRKLFAAGRIPRRSPNPFDTLEGLHDAASRYPHSAALFLHAADRLRAEEGITLPSTLCAGGAL
jgi:hypothetical protein